MNFRKGQRRSVPEINLIAFIDVLLVILIFLMVSTSFSRYTGLQVKLPEAAADAPAVAGSVTVAIDSQGRYAIDQQRLPAADTASIASALLRAAHNDPGTLIEIHADAVSSHQSVMQVMEAARIAGLPRLVFAAQSVAR